MFLLTGSKIYLNILTDLNTNRWLNFDYISDYVSDNISAFALFYSAIFSKHSLNIHSYA